MLISNDLPKLNDVVSIRLVSGDEIVGKLLDSPSADVVRIGRPITAVMQPDGRGNMGLAFAPFMATANDLAEVSIPVSATICRPVKTREDIAKGYTASTSPILQPEKGLLIP